MSLILVQEGAEVLAGILSVLDVVHTRERSQRSHSEDVHQRPEPEKVSRPEDGKDNLSIVSYIRPCTEASSRVYDGDKEGYCGEGHTYYRPQINCPGLQSSVLRHCVSRQMEVISSRDKKAQPNVARTGRQGEIKTGRAGAHLRTEKEEDIEIQCGDRLKREEGEIEEMPQVCRDGGGRGEGVNNERLKIEKGSGRERKRDN